MVGLIALQYTGVKDKNNVEICNADIVEQKGGKRGFITFYAGGFYWQNKDTTMTPLAELGYGKGSDFEVIGNTYEDPDLFVLY